MWKYSNQPFAAEAQLSAADNPAEALSSLTEKLGELKSVLATLRPEYEYTGPRTLGGIPNATTPYTMSNPFGHLPCEVYIGTICTQGSGAQNGVLTTEAGLTVADVAGANVTLALDGSKQFYQPFALNGNGTTHGWLGWLPITGEKLYLYLGGAGSNGTYVTLQFRRRINAVGVPSYGY